MKGTGLIKPDINVASALAPKLHLMDVLCAAMSAKIVSADEPTRLSYKVHDMDVWWHLNDEGIMRVVLPYSLSAYSEAEQSSSTIIASISVTMRADYVVKDGEGSPTLKELPHYAGIMGYMHTWPYFRADVQYLSTKLGFPALVLPVVISGQIPDRVSVRAIPMKEPPSAKSSTTTGVPSEQPQRRIPSKRAKLPITKSR